MESAETISAGMRSASASATAVLPDAVGPKMAKTVSLTESGAGELQILIRETARPQVAPHAPVASLQLLEHVDHRLCGCRGDPADALPLCLRSGFREPLLVTRPQPLLAQRIVGRDLFDAHAGEAEQQRGDEAGSVLAPRAVDDDTALRRARDLGDGAREVLLEPLEEDEVHVAGRHRVVRRGLRGLVRLGKDVRVFLERRNVN